MDLKLLCYEYIVLVFLLSMCHHGLGIDEDDYDDHHSFGRCPWIRKTLKNGRVKLRSRGRIAKFLCDPGYELAGKRFATCVKGQWNNPIPVCVARGCSRKPPISNGRVTEMYRGAMLVYDCNPGYSLFGSVSIYCDGRRWSSDAPECVVTTSDPKTSCDFEEPDLCGWSHDPTHDFDWKRNQFATPSGHVGTGPSYDHTFGIGKGGFYLYLEASSPRRENDAARLFSPVYPRDFSGGCFIFWYHMYGATTGGLRVYLKPESHVFGELSPTWEKFGDQGNQWLRGHITVPTLQEKFQLVIEGIRGTSYVGDSAIDDVQLTQSDCETMENATDTVVDTVAESCRGRCSQSDGESTCGCNSSCLKTDTCCSDYVMICTAGNDTSAENPDETLPNEELGTTKSPVTVFVNKNAATENAVVETKQSMENVSNETATETTQVVTITVSSLTSSAISSTTLLPTSLQSTSTSLPTTLSTLLPSLASTASPLTTTSAPKSSSSESPKTSSTTKQTTQALVTSTSAKRTTKIPEIITTVSKPTTTTTTQSPASSTYILSTVTVFSTSASAPTTLVLENTSVEHNTSIAVITVPSTTVSTKSEDVSSSTTSTSTTSTSTTSTPGTTTITSTPSTTTITSTPSTTITITPSTRKTYNLRPRTQKTTPITSTTITRTSASSTTARTTISTAFSPTSIYQSTTLPNVILRLSSTSSRAPFISSTKSTTTTESTVRTTVLKTSTKKQFDSRTRNIVTDKTPKSTETIPQTFTIPKSVNSNASHAASKAGSDSQPTVTIVSLSILAVLCVAGGLAYYIKKQKDKRRWKSSFDSEMRYLPENEEIMEYSDASALDKILVT